MYEAPVSRNFLDKRRINDTQKLSKTKALVVAKAFYCVGKLFPAFYERKLNFPAIYWVGKLFARVY